MDHKSAIKKHQVSEIHLGVTASEKVNTFFKSETHTGGPLLLHEARQTERQPL
jgi:hypothetical protein